MNRADFWSKTSIGLILVLLASLHLVRHYQLIQAHNYPAGLDPYYFSAASEAIAKELPVRPLDSFMIDNTGNLYPPLLYWMVGLVARVTSIAAIDLYLWLGPILGALLIPVAYLAFVRLVSPWPALFGAAAYAFSPFVLTRTFLTLPENLAVIWFFGLLWLYFGAFSWKNVALGIGLWIAMFLTHLTSFYALAVIGLWLGQVNLIKRYWRWYGVGLGLATIVAFSPPVQSSISTLWQLSKTSAIGWSPPTLQFLDQYLTLGLVALAGAGLVVAAWTWRQPRAKKLLTLASPFLFFLLFYKTQLQDFGPIWPERFLMYTAIPVALLAAWFLEMVIAQYNPRRLILACGMATLVVVFTATPAFYWFWPFNGEEVQAARYLAHKSPANSVIIAQPLLNWLIRAVGQRSVLWIDTDRQPPTIALPSLPAMKDRWGNFSARPFYIFVSRAKKTNPYVAEFLDGTFKNVGYPDRFLPSYDENILAGLPKIYDTPAVTIYYLNPPPNLTN